MNFRHGDVLRQAYDFAKTFVKVGAGIAAATGIVAGVIYLSARACDIESAAEEQIIQGRYDTHCVEDKVENRNVANFGELK